MIIKLKKNKFKIGIWAHKRKGYKDKDLIGPDPDITKDFEDAINKPHPK